MYQTQDKNSVNAPLLDRLIDHEPQTHTEKIVFNTVSVDELHENIKQNLEHLLNSRIKGGPYPKEFIELRQSCLNYGIPDFSGYNFLNDQSHHDLCQIIQKTIETFEPRLNHITVHMIESDEIEIKRSLSIRIEATIIMANKLHATAFNSSLDVVSKNFTFNH